MIFSEIGNSQIWWTIGGGQDSATGHPDTLRTFRSIRFIQVLVLASVNIKYPPTNLYRADKPTYIWLDEVVYDTQIIIRKHSCVEKEYQNN